MRRLSGLDAQFLYVELPTNHQQGAPAPGGPRELGEVVSEIASWQLDRSRPLWELWMVEGLEGGCVASVAKAHHSLADGVASAGLLDSFYDPHAVAELPEPPPYRPQPIPPQRCWPGGASSISCPCSGAARRTTINDVLAAVAGALRRYLAANKEAVDRPLVASVPMSTRTEAGRYMFADPVAPTRVRSFFSVGPLTEGVGLNVTAWSYVDQLNVCMLGCREAAPDLWDLADLVRDSVEELAKAAVEREGASA